MHDNSIEAFFYLALHLDVFDNFGQVSDKYVLKNTSYITKLSSSPVENTSQPGDVFPENPVKI